jgi:hypothetical protein
MNVRRTVRAGLLVALPFFSLLGQGESKPAQHPTMSELVAEFERSPTPKISDLVGDWVETTIIYSAGPSVIRGGFHGPDLVTVDSNGFRRENGKLDWLLSMQRENEKLIFVSTTQWSAVEHSSVSFTDRGDVSFSKDYGGDAAYRYHCRMPTKTRMICIIDRPSPGHGIAFRRTR